MADSTDSGVEVMEKQDVAEEENRVSENESHEIMSETGSSNIVEGGVDDDSSNLLHFKDSEESGSRLHTVPRFQTSTLTTDSMLDKSALLAQRSSTPSQCHQQEADASNLQEDASGDHNHSTNIAEEKLLVPQSGISYADTNRQLNNLYGTDPLTVEEHRKENSEGIVKKTSLPDHPLSEKKKQSDISVVNLDRIIKLAERRKKELFKSHVDGLKSLEESSNNGDLDDSSGITTGGSQSQDSFHGQPHKEEVKTEKDNKDSAFETQCNAHGRPKSHFCISCDVYTCFQCLYTHIGHDVKHKDEILIITNSIMKELKFMSDCIASSQNLVKLHSRTAVKQQFLALKQNTDGYLRKFEEFKCAQIARLNQEESRLQDEIADMHRTKKQIWKEKKQLLKNVEKDLQIMIAKAKISGNSGNRQNLQQKLQYLKSGQEILDKLPSLYCQVLSHEVDPEPVDIQMDPILNKWKFVKSTVVKPELDESLTDCAAVSKKVIFKATENCDKMYRGAKNNIKLRYQTVSSMNEFENWSFEEIRWSHYVSEKIVSSSQQNKLMQDPLFDFGTSFVDLSSAKSTAKSTRFSKSKTSSTTAALSENTRNLSAKTAVFKTSNQVTSTTSSSETCSFGSRISAFEQETSLDPTKSVPYSGKFNFDDMLTKFEQPKTSSDEDQAKSVSKPFSFGTFAQPKTSSVDPTKTTSYSGNVMPSKDKATPISTSGTFSFGSSLNTVEQPKTSSLDPIKQTPYSGTAAVGSSLSAFGQAQTLSKDQPMPTTTSGTVSFGSGLSTFEQPSEKPKTSFLSQATAATPFSGSFSFGAIEQSKRSSLDQTKLIQSSGTVASGSSLSTFGQLKTSVTDHVMPTKTSSSTSRFGSKLSTFEQPKKSSSDQAIPTKISTSGTSSFGFPLSFFGQPKPSSLNQSTASTSSSGIFFGAVEQPKTSLEPTKPIVSSGTFSFGSTSGLSTFEQPKSTSLDQANATSCSGIASYGSWSSTLGQTKTAATTTSSSSGSFSFVFKLELDESLTDCAVVSKKVKFKAREGCEYIYRGAENIKVRYQNVSSMTEFENWSFEEIRWSHYVSEKIVSSSQQNKLMQDFGTSFVDLSSAKPTATSTWFSKSKTSSTTASLSERTKTLSTKKAVFKTSIQATSTTSSSGTCSFGSRMSAFEQETSLDPTKPVSSGKFSFDNLLGKLEQPKEEDQAKSTSISKPFSFGTLAQPKTSSVDLTKTTSYSGKVSYGSSLATFGQLKMPSKDKATPISTSGTFSFGSSLNTVEQPKTSSLDPIKPIPYSGTAAVGSSLSAFGQAQTLSTDQPMPTTTSGTVSFSSGVSAFDQPKTFSEQPKTSFFNQSTATTPSSGSFSFGAFEQSKPSSLDPTKLIQSKGTVANGSSLSTFGQLKTSVTDHVMPKKPSSSTSRFGTGLSTFEQPKTSSSDQAMPTTSSTSGTPSCGFPLPTFGQPKPSSLNQSTATTSSGSFRFVAIEKPKPSKKPIISSETFNVGSTSGLPTSEQPKSISLYGANAKPCSGTASYVGSSSTLGQPKTAATTTTSSSSRSFSFGALEQPKTSLEPTKPVPSSGTFSFGSTSGLSTFKQPKSTSLDQANATPCSGTASYGSWSSTLFGQPKTAATTTTSSSSGSFKFGALEQPKTSLEPTKPIPSSGTFSFGRTSGLSTFEQPKITSLDIANATPCSRTVSCVSSSSTLGQPKTAATTTTSSFSGSIKFGALEQPKTSLEPTKPVPSSGTFSFGSTSGLSTFEQPKSTSLDIANATPCSRTASYYDGMF